MKVLVTGANGQLGRCLRDVHSKIEAEWIFSDVTLAEGLPTRLLDICDAAAVDALVDDEGIDVIVNCAAYTDVARSESDPETAARLNSYAPGVLASAMKRRGGLLVHISTDYVFGLEPYNTPCTEDRKGTPTGVYGLTKLRGEQAIAQSQCRSVIIRTAWLYSAYGKNFVKTMLDLTSRKDELKVVFDQAGTPTYAGDLAELILKVIASPVPGIYHYSNEGVCSWYDFAVMISRLSGHDACRIKPCHSDEFPSPVVRPSYSVLDKTLVKNTYGISIPYWIDSLKLCLEQLGIEIKQF